MAKRSNKGARIIKAAKKLIHQKGFHQTTLAHIAIEANVPLGNVYYYFNSKELIVKAVIKELKEEFDECFSHLEKMPIESRLLSFLEFSPESLEFITQYGCPIGSLYAELGKERGTLGMEVAKIFQDILNWCETQFKRLGFASKAHEYALYLVGSLQGAYLLAHSFNNLTFMNRQLEILHTWLGERVQEVLPTPREAIA